MATRLIKESRELLPVLVGTVVLMAAPRMVWPQQTEATGMATIFAFGLGCAVMGALAFGSELQHRTLGLLLSQPIRRSVLWREKMLVLAVGMAVSFGVAAACLNGFGLPGAAPDPRVRLLLGLMVGCAFCGTPYLTLRTRSGIGGVVFAALLPGVIIGIVGPLTERLFPDTSMPEWVMGAGLLAYCAVAYWRGYCRFRDLEVQEGGARELALPASLERFLAHGLGSMLPSLTGPMGALIKKELRLQQMSFILAGLFSALLVVAGVAHWLSPKFSEIILTVDCVVYLLLLPFMVGAMAVAEERGLGISEWHLTLPASALKQWSAKMLVALGTSVGLGLLLPGLWGLVAWLLSGAAGGRAEFPSAQMLVSSAQVVVSILLSQLLATSVAAYTASFCGNTVRAILLAFGMIVTGCTLVLFEEGLLASWVSRWGYPPEKSPNWELMAWALSCIGLLLLLGLLQGLAFVNFRRGGMPARRFVLQLVGIVLLVGLLGLGFYWLVLFARFG